MGTQRGIRAVLGLAMGLAAACAEHEVGGVAAHLSLAELSPDESRQLCRTLGVERAVEAELPVTCTLTGLTADMLGAGSCEQVREDCMREHVSEQEQAVRPQVERWCDGTPGFSCPGVSVAELRACSDAMLAAEPAMDCSSSAAGQDDDGPEGAPVESVDVTQLSECTQLRRACPEALAILR